MRRLIVGILAVIGGVSSALFFSCMGLGLRDAYLDKNPTADHLAYVVNWTDLGDHTRILEVEAVCADWPNPMVGDRTRAYKMKLAPIAPGAIKFDERSPWVKPPLSDPLLVKAIETAAMFARSDECTWFPRAEELNSDRFYLSFPEVTAYHGQVEGVDLTALEIATQTLYHAEVRW